MKTYHFAIPGLYSKQDLRYLTAKDFRSCISSWASDHRNEEIRMHAAALQNHSAIIHESKYRRNKIKQATGQSLALMKDMNEAGGEDTDESEYEVQSSFQRF
jgi:hypothetical protein